MLNAKLTATGRHSVCLPSLRLASLFPVPDTLSLLSSYCRSIVILFPHFHAILFRTNGETKKDRPDQAKAGKGARTKRVSAASVEKNYKRFAPLHLDESQIILRPRASAAGTSVAKTTEERERKQYICIHTPYIERRQS